MKHYDLSGLSVLLIEDEYNMRMLFRSILKALEIGKVYIEGNLEEGFKTCTVMNPDILITNWTPQFDGLGLIARLRNSQGDVQSLPIIVMSAYCEINHIEAARDSGASQFLVKPFSATGLYNRILAAIEDEQQFIAGEKYKGPCRRRRTLEFKGDDRRVNNVVESEGPHHGDESS